jgi:hypothetical protein
MGHYHEALEKISECRQKIAEAEGAETEQADQDL